MSFCDSTNAYTCMRNQSVTDEGQQIRHNSKDRKMVDGANKGGEKSPDLLELPFVCRCTRLRAAFLILLISSVLLFYNVSLSEVSKMWYETVQTIYNTTDNAARAASNVSVNASSPHWTSTFIPGSERPVSPSALPGEKCTPETPYTVAYPCKYSFIVNEAEGCRNNTTFLVLMVPVAPQNRQARDVIRTTWGSEKSAVDKVVRLFFLLGQSTPEGRENLQQTLSQESEEHRDIIQSDFLDSYKNLTIKTMVMLEWLMTYCQNAAYAMKIDSDMFLNVNALIKMLVHAPKHNYITGLVAHGAMVLRNPDSKWFLPKNVFPEDFYPPYALGLGYVFSLDLAEKLVKGAKQVQAVYIEDVFLGLCMRHLGIPYTSQTDQGLFNIFPVPYNRCRYSQLIATTTYNVQHQVDSWKDLQRPGPPC